MRAPAETHPPQLEEPPAPPPAGPTAWLRANAPALALVALAGGLVAAFYLGLYWAKRYNMPIGWDTPRYLDQTNLVAAHGLRGVPQHLPPPIKTLPSRGGFPIIILTLASLLGVSTFKTAAVVPPAAAAALALAAGALITWALRRGVWSLAAAALIVGSSSVMIRLIAPETYSDNVFAGAILVAALVPLLSAATGSAGMVAAAILLGAAAIAHGPSFAVVAMALGVAALVVLPRSWRAWRRGDEGALRTPTARLLAPLAGGLAVAGAAFAVVLRAAPDTPKLSRGELVKKFRQDVPLYRYWLSAPLAAIGAFGLWSRRDRGAAGRDGDGDSCPGVLAPARVLLLVLGAWTLVALGGVALYLMGRNVPAHRFLSFLLPLPILVAVAILWLASAAGRRAARWAGRAAGATVVGAAVAVAAIAGFAALGFHDLYGTLAGPSRGVEWLDMGKVQDAATAGAYLDAARVPPAAPVVFVVDDRGPNPLSYVPEMAYMLRAILPADRVPHAYIYVGNPERYLAGEPTYRSHPRTYDANANRFWPAVRALLPQRPVALLLSSYNTLYTAEASRHPESVVAPNVIALTGPRPAQAVSAPPIPTGPRGAAQGALLGVAALAVLTLVGYGWAAGVLPRSVRAFETFALAPAFGLAFLILGGIVADALGVRLVGAGGALVPVLVGAAGAGMAAARWKAGRA